MSFNAIYGGEPDARERRRVMNAVRRFVSRRDARNILERNRAAIVQLIDLPPGNMRLEARDPQFRIASQRCARLYLDTRETPEARLAGAAGTLYQVRCNLVHGSKDPRSARDRMLVRESLRVLRDLVPSVERGAQSE
jgi:hypothetical protein